MQRILVHLHNLIVSFKSSTFLLNDNPRHTVGKYGGEKECCSKDYSEGKRGFAVTPLHHSHQLLIDFLFLDTESALITFQLPDGRKITAFIL